MIRKDILLASPARTGNTFLYSCLNEANGMNMPRDNRIVISGSLRSPTILSFDQNDDIKIYTNFRTPIDMIISSVVRKMFFQYGADYKYDSKTTTFHDHIFASIYDYKEYIEFQHKHMKATIILFDQLIANPNHVIEKIFEDIGIEYVNPISVDKIKAEIKDRTRKAFIGSEPTGDFVGGYGNLPFGIETMVYYDALKDEILNSLDFYELDKLYNETLDKARSGACKLISDPIVKI